MSIFLALVLLSIFSFAPLIVTGRVISFSNRNWIVRSTSTAKQGPGPNNWQSDNVWVDNNGFLHLKLTQRNGNWYCSEVILQERLGYGRYQFQILGAIDRLDPNVVVGLFNYPDADVGPDGTNEIDIEFSRWGVPGGKMGSYTVYPSQAGTKSTTHQFDINLNGEATTHSFTWSPSSIHFSSNHGFQQTDSAQQFASWTFAPLEQRRIPQNPLPVHMNLWLMKGFPPINGQEVEIVVKSFSFSPL